MLLEFVKVCHGSQVRKYTGEPYWHHVVSVATIASQYDHYNYNLTKEIALCHDLFEDTDCDKGDLRTALQNFGYTNAEHAHIARGVQDLTDEWTSEKYPHINRSRRKAYEAARLGETQGYIQTIKYSDLIDNTQSIVNEDPGFAKVYLEEKVELLKMMRTGNFDLYIRVCASLYNSLEKLNLVA